MQAWLRLGEVAREGTAVGVGVADVGARVDVLASRSMSAISWLSSDPMHVMVWNSQFPANTCAGLNNYIII
jgi:hypothetical protein